VTRVLYWNVNAFGDASLFTTRPGDPDPDYNAPPFQSATDRRTLFLNVAQAIQPDIISIVEVQPGQNGIAQGAAIVEPAAFKLLARLRQSVAADFQLIPPLVSGAGGRAEAVAIYYRRTPLLFLGPWGWNGGLSERMANLGNPPGLGRYPAADWGAGAAAALPDEAVPPGWPNAGCRQSGLAGQWQYTNAHGVVQFGNNGNRTPWLTCFGERASGRILKLFSFHAPPDQIPEIDYDDANAAGAALSASVAGTRAFAELAEISGAGNLAQNEVRCVLGDFNISAFDAHSDLNSYAIFRNAHYTQQLNPIAQVNPIPYEWPQIGYYATHIKGWQTANPWISVGIDEAIRGYPGFGYVSAKGRFGWYDVIDNVFTRYGANAGQANGMTIVNPVIGSPYVVGPTHPANVLRGTLPLGSQLGDLGAAFHYTLADAFAGVAERDDEDGSIRNDFQEWPNYRKIRSLSDHLPLAINI
jgi:hypothetical protein